jgi:hypothetical protein
VAVLSRLAKLVDDYRAAKTGVALVGGVGAALSPLSALAQDKAPGSVQTAQVQPGVPVVKSSFVKPPMPLEPHCPIITLAFEKVGVQGDFKMQINSWTAGGCKGDVPVPDASDQFNAKRFGAVARILQNGGNIVLTP